MKLYLPKHVSRFAMYFNYIRQHCSCWFTVFMTRSMSDQYLGRFLENTVFFLSSSYSGSNLCSENIKLYRYVCRQNLSLIGDLNGYRFV